MVTPHELLRAIDFVNKKYPNCTDIIFKDKMIKKALEIFDKNEEV